jgi:hypothetical protein
MLRFGYVDYKNGFSNEYVIMPTVKTSYNFTRDMSFEFEAGNKQVLRDTPKGRETESEWLLLTGMRYDFNTDRTVK